MSTQSSLLRVWIGRLLLAGVTPMLLGGCPPPPDPDPKPDVITQALSGLQGPAGPQGYSDPTGPEGPAGPIDSTPSDSPTGLRIGAHIGGPPEFDLYWNLPEGGPAVEYFLIYESGAPITSANRASARRAAVAGGARSSIIQLYANSGSRFLRIAAVSYTGIEGALSDEYEIDTTARLAILGDTRSDGVDELSTVSAAGGEVTCVSGTLVSGGDVTVGNAAWSPTGLYLAFIADKDTNGLDELYTVRVATSDITKISGELVSGGDVKAFRWSPDGSHLAFRADKDVNDVDELYVVAASGGTVTKLSGSMVPNGGAGNFSWSPDGSRIAFRADKDTGGKHELYSVAADGGDVSNVSGPLASGGVVTNFEWSPDSSRIAFRAVKDIAGRSELYCASPDGANMTKLSGTLASGGDVSSLRWSPDSTRLAFVADKDTIDVKELYVVAASGGEAVKVSGPLGAGGNVVSHQFAWSPDGTRLAFVADKDTDTVLELYTVAAGGGAATKVSGTMVPGGGLTVNRNFAWSPDGSRIAFLAAKETVGVLELYTVAAFGGEAIKVSGSLAPNNDVSPYFSWSPDGLQMTFMVSNGSSNMADQYVTSPFGGAPLKVASWLNPAVNLHGLDSPWSPLCG